MDHPTIAKISSFLSLEDGWNYGEGVAPTASKASEAAGLVRLLEGLGLSETNAFPGMDGEILIRAYHHDHVLSFTLETDGTISMSHLVRGEHQECPDVVSLEQIKYYAMRILIESIFDACPMYMCASPTQSYLIIGPARSQNLPLKRAGVTAAPLLFNASASLPGRNQYVSMSPDITQASAARHPYTALSM